MTKSDSIPTSKKDFDCTCGMLCEKMQEITDRNGIDFSRINAVGISCSGPPDSAKGITLCPPNPPGWVNIPLPEMIYERFSVPAFIQTTPTPVRCNRGKAV